jgi:hypothetical protein
MRVLAGAQKYAAYLVRVSGIVEVEAHDRVAALHRFHEIVPNDDRNLAEAITKIVYVCERWMSARDIPQQKESASKRRYDHRLAVAKYARL